jgi:hypothetical protein
MGGQPWSSSRSINDGMASSRERKGREGERRARLGAAWGGGGLQGAPWGGLAGCSWLFLYALFVLNVRRKQQAGRRRREGGKREEKEKEGKEKKRKKKKKWNNFQT